MHTTFTANIGFSTNESVVQFNYNTQADTYTAQILSNEEGDEDLAQYVAMFVINAPADSDSATRTQIANAFCTYFSVVHLQTLDSTWLDKVN